MGTLSDKLVASGVVSPEDQRRCDIEKVVERAFQKPHNSEFAFLKIQVWKDLLWYGDPAWFRGILEKYNYTIHSYESNGVFFANRLVWQKAEIQSGFSVRSLA